MGQSTRRSAAVLLILVAGAAQSAGAGTIQGSPHDLSRDSPYLCAACHVPLVSGQNAARIPSWTRDRVGLGFAVYGVPPGSPGASEIPHKSLWPGASTRMCLSCHDGLNASPVLHGIESYALGEHYGRTPSAIDPAVLVRPAVARNDLIGVHPVLVPFPSQLAADFHVLPSASGSGRLSPRTVQLVAGWVECVSCHNVHDSTFPPFLRRSNTGSEMCLTCHKK